MLNQQTIEKLYAMRMRGMADAFTQQQEDPQTTQLSFEERFALLVDRSGTGGRTGLWRRRLKEARLQGPACIEDIDFRAARGLDKQVVRSLINDSDWVRRHQHIFLVGPTGIGKTFLARAFGQKACRDGFTAYFATAAQLFRELELARADGSYAKKLRALGQVDALIVDDWAMTPLTDAERRAFLEICDERYPDQVDAADQPTAGGEVACANRRSHGGRQHSGSVGACRAPARTAGRIDAKEEGPSCSQGGRVSAGRFAALASVPP